MEDKSQMFSHREPLEESEPEMAQRFSRSPNHPITRSPDDPVRSSDQPVSRSADSHACRECLAAMAHRLAQPMTALRGGIELGLMGKRSAADYRSLLEQSLELADDMAQLITSLRDLGESGVPGGPPQCVLLAATATEVVAEMEGLAQSRDLHLQFTAEGEARICANPERLREALQTLLAWVIQNCAAGGDITLQLTASEGEARTLLSPPRLDLQYLQIKVLEDITNPGLLFSQAAKNGALGWAINQRLLNGLGGKLEILTDGPDAGCIRVSFPLAPAS
jgi:signal transduction histidine kinase